MTDPTPDTDTRTDSSPWAAGDVPDDSYPTTADSTPDHEAAWEYLFPDGASRRFPTFITDGAETVAVVGRDGTTAEILDPHMAATDPRTVDLRALWRDYHHDSLNYRRRAFLKPEEATYDTEREAVVDRETLRDVLAEAAGALPVETVADLEGALEASEAGPA